MALHLHYPPYLHRHSNKGTFPHSCPSLGFHLDSCCRSTHPPTPQTPRSTQASTVPPSAELSRAGRPAAPVTQATVVHKLNLHPRAACSCGGRRWCGLRLRTCTCEVGKGVERAEGVNKVGECGRIGARRGGGHRGPAKGVRRVGGPDTGAEFTCSALISSFTSCFNSSRSFARCSFACTGTGTGTQVGGDGTGARRSHLGWVL